MVFKKVAKLDQVEEGKGIGVEVDGVKIALFKVEGDIKAVRAECARHGAPLDRAVVEDETLFCPWHGVPFDMDTGICAEFPDQVSAKTFDVRVEDQDILVDVS